MPRPTKAHPAAPLFGALFRRLRMERGWTIRTGAQRLGMNPTYLGVLEAGGNMPSIDTLFEMADVFNVKASDIVREIEERITSSSKETV